MKTGRRPTFCRKIPGRINKYQTKPKRLKNTYPVQFPYIPGLGGRDAAIHSGLSLGKMKGDDSLTKVIKILCAVCVAVGTVALSSVAACGAAVYAIGKGMLAARKMVCAIVWGSRQRLLPGAEAVCLEAGTTPGGTR